VARASISIPDAAGFIRATGEAAGPQFACGPVADSTGPQRADALARWMHAIEQQIVHGTIWFGAMRVEGGVNVNQRRTSFLRHFAYGFRVGLEQHVESIGSAGAYGGLPYKDRNLSVQRSGLGVMRIG